MKVKVCGMKDAANIAEVAALEPDYMGFIFYERSPRFAGTLDPAALGAVPAGTVRVGVFVDAPLEYIRNMCRKYSLDAVQLHGNESPAKCAELRREYAVIKAFGISCVEDMDTVEEYEGTCDYFLFDTKTPLKGGSGEKFDHSTLSVYTGDTPFFLSGGIGPDDTVLHDKSLKCCAVDVNSRFELAPGVKDADMLREFFNKIRKTR